MALNLWIRYGFLLSFLYTIIYLVRFSVTNQNQLEPSVAVIVTKPDNSRHVQSSSNQHFSNTYDSSYSNDNNHNHNCIVALGYPHSGITDIVQALTVATNSNKGGPHNGIIPASLWNTATTENRLLFENLDRIQQHYPGTVFLFGHHSLDDSLLPVCTTVKLVIIRRDMFEVLATTAETLSISETQPCPIRNRNSDDLLGAEEFQFQLAVLSQPITTNHETSCLLRLATHYLEYDRQLQSIEVEQANNNNNNNDYYQVERISHRDFLRHPNERLQSWCTFLDCHEPLESVKQQTPVRRKKPRWSTQTMSHLQHLVHETNDACGTSPAGYTAAGPFTVYSSQRINNDHPTGIMTDLSDFLTGPGLEQSLLDDDPAICEFMGGQFHFPHAMEQLYSCFSWWQAHPHSPSVLVYNSSKAFPSGFRKQGLRHRSPFVQGILEHFEQVVGVEIVDQISSDHEVGLVVFRGTEPNAKYGNFVMRLFQLRGPQDALALSLGVLRHNERTKTIQAATARKKRLVPRVAILNRGYRHDKPERSLLNAQQVRNALKLASHSNNETLYSVAPVAYFESASFLDQVDFFSYNDIVISPHGAQLTGIAFLPSCGSVMELFPKGYSIPEVFGSLAATSGLHHSYIYMSQGEETEENAIHMQGGPNREASRSVDFCGTPSQIVDAVQLLVEEWKQCQVRSIDS